MAVPDQLIMPLVQGKGGVAVELRMNRVTEANESTTKIYTLADTTRSLRLTKPVKWLEKMSPIRRERTLSVSLPNEMDFEIHDSFTYTGVLGDGTSQTEDFSTSGSSLLEQFFNNYDSTTYYKVFVSAVHAYGSDLVTNGTTTVTSATGGFTSAHVGLAIEVGYNIVRTISSVTNTNTAVLNATVTAGTGQTWKVTELCFVGAIDPTTIAEPHHWALDSHTANELRRSTWKLKANSLKTVLEKKTVEDLRDTITSSDMVVSTRRPFYGGIMLKKDGAYAAYSDNLDKEYNTPLTGEEHAGLSPLVGRGWPNGAYGITPYKILEKLLDIANISISGQDATFTGYIDDIAASDVRWTPGYIPGTPLTQHLAVQYNILFGYTMSEFHGAVIVDTVNNKLKTNSGVHPQEDDIIHFCDTSTSTDTPITTYYVINTNPSDGGYYTFQISTTEGGSAELVSGLPNYDVGGTTFSRWGYLYTDFPGTWKKDTPLIDIVKLICNQFGFVFEQGYDQLNKKATAYFRSIRKPGGSDLSSHLATYFQGSDTVPQKRKYEHVKLKFSNTEGYAYCPHERGEGLEIEVPFQVRPWGEKYSHKVKHVVYDKSRAATDQQALWWMSTNGHYLGSPNSNLLIPGQYLYFYYGTGATANFAYPSSYQSLYADTNFKGFYALSYWKWRGEGLEVNLITGSGDEARYGDARYDLAQLYANEYLFGHTLERVYLTCVGPNGRVNELTTGIIASWNYRGSDRSFKGEAVDVDLLEGTCRIVWIEYSPSGGTQSDRYFAPLPVYYKDGEGTVSGGSGTSGGSGNNSGGGTGGGTTDLALLVAPPTAARNTTLPTADVTPITIKGYSDGTAKLLEWQKNISSTATTVGRITNLGAVELLPHGTSAGNTNELRFYELAANGSHNVALKAPDSLPATLTFTLPASIVTDGYLKTSASGVLSFDSGPTTDLTNAVILNPQTSTRNRVQSDQDVVPFSVKGKTSGQSQHLMDIIQGGGTIQAYFDSSGDFHGKYVYVSQQLNVTGTDTSVPCLYVEPPSSHANYSVFIARAGGATKDFQIDQNNRLGLGPIAEPAVTRVQVAGDVSFEPVGVAQVNGANGTISPAEALNVRLTGPTAAYSIQGINGGQNGKFLVLLNATAQTLTLTHNDPGTSATARFDCPGAANYTVNAGACKLLVYDAVSQRWRVCE